MTEIERKFLVTSTDFISESTTQFRIVQGYLNSNPVRTVRVRIKGDKGFLTIKGKGNESGMSRFEWEKEIDPAEAEELLKICEPGVIIKNRYEVNNAPFVFEVDEFLEENNGLIVAEIELENENDDFHKPYWIGKEVTGDIKYYNSMLIKNPFTKW